VNQSGNGSFRIDSDPVNRRSAASGLYLHLPFCATRCAYCTFVSGVDLKRMEVLIAAMVTEIRRLRRPGKRPLATLYFGGGTPSLVPRRLLARLVTALAGAFTFLPDLEATIEANPDDVDALCLASWRELGFTRISIGIQSLDDATLRLIGRRHDAGQAMAAVAAARACGLAVSVDLIAGLPGRGRGALLDSVATVIAARPEHVSLYALELDKPHALGERGAREAGFLPDADEVADQLVASWKLLADAGYRQYEISNFAQPGCEARHNQRYWSQDTVLAVGVGAFGQAGRRRWGNFADVARYLEAVRAGRAPRAFSRFLPADEVLRERVMLALRTAAGASDSDVAACSALAPDFADRINDFRVLGMVRREGGRLALTREGWLVSNELLAALW